jgi:hypothetical protein
MKNVRIDTDGELRCWNCGGKTMIEKRTLRSKALVGVGALLTKKKLKCRICSEYNDVGSAEPYKGPANKKLGKKFDTYTAMYGAEQPDGVMATAQESPAGWQPDPLGRYEYRWWDGADWTADVSVGGVASTDPNGTDGLL